MPVPPRSPSRWRRTPGLDGSGGQAGLAQRAGVQWFGQVSSLNVALGGAALPDFAPFHVLFACLMGSVVLVWSALRILEPTQRLGRFDGIARFLFSLWMAWCLALTGAPVLWLFVVPEFAWGVAQWWPVHGQASGQRYNGALSRTSQAC